MVSIRTKRLREKADVLNKAALHYDYRFAALEECISWIKHQEFDEKNDIHQILARQYEELRKQKKELLLLSEVVQRACDKYDETEQRIIENGEVYRKLTGYVEMINLEQIRDRLSSLGIRVTGQ